MQSPDFYQSHLDQVSRSFAFCIKKLPEPFRQWVSLSYLLCRTLDTIEDALWTSNDLRHSQYETFESFLGQSLPISFDQAQAKEWSEKFPRSLSQAELRLVDDIALLISDLHELPVQVRLPIQNTVCRMCSGMRYYAERTSDGVLRLHDLTDVNRYCYFVAGIVGELLTQLFSRFDREFTVTEQTQRDAFHFGLFLQKINLLKDQKGDEKQGRYLVPDRSQLLASLKENANGAMQYIISLPTSAREYRTFCAWSLFLGAASIPFIESSHSDQPEAKISREMTLRLMDTIETIVQDNRALQEGFRTYFPNLPILEFSPAADGADWFTKLAGSSLGKKELIELRMISS